MLNVGIAIGGAFADTSLEDHLKVLAINVTGTTYMAKRVVDHMVANRDGSILIVSSISATTPMPYEGVRGARRPSATHSTKGCEKNRANTASTSQHYSRAPPTATSTATAAWAPTCRSAACRSSPGPKSHDSDMRC